MSADLAWWERLYADFNARDVPAVLRWFAPDVHWANGWEGGHVVGHDAVAEYWRRQWAEIDPSVTPLQVDTAADGSIEVLVRQRVLALDGTEIDDRKVLHRYTFDRGLVTGMDIEQV